MRDPAGLINFGNALRQVAGGTNIYVAAGNYLATIIHLLESTGNFKVISRPTVFTSNNKKAIIASGQEIPVPVNTLTNATTVNNVAAANGSTIVLGGLIQDNKGKNYTGIPVLSRLPVIGAAFRSTVKTGNRTELIILMCPEVTLTKLDLYRLRAKNEDKTHFGPEIDQENCPDCPPRAGEEKQLQPVEVQGAKDF